MLFVRNNTRYGKGNMTECHWFKEVFSCVAVVNVCGAGCVESCSCCCVLNCARILGSEVVNGIEMLLTKYMKIRWHRWIGVPDNDVVEVPSVPPAFWVCCFLERGFSSLWGERRRMDHTVWPLASIFLLWGIFTPSCLALFFLVPVASFLCSVGWAVSPLWLFRQHIPLFKPVRLLSLGHRLRTP